MSFTFNVKDPYGAIGDGTTDDTDSIQRAIDDAHDSAVGVYNGDNPASAVGVGGVVFFPKGTYLTTAPLKLPPTVTLMGEGPASLIKSIFDAPGPYDRWNGAIEMTAAGWIMQATVRDLSIFTHPLHCGITYDLTKQVWPAKVFTAQNSTFTDWTTINNSPLFRNGSYTVLTGTGDYLYVGFTNKTDLIGSTEGGLFWTRRKQLGFKDKWGSRLDLEWQYSKGNNAFGSVDTWETFGPAAELGGGFWHYGHNGTFLPDFRANWIAGQVSTSGSLYWIRIRSASPVYQAPIAHHVYPGFRALINMCTFENLYFNCSNWAIFFGLFCYCQHCRFRGIRTVRNGGGCIWVVGNSNYITQCDTEGGTRDNANIGSVADPGQFTIEGDGNSIRDIIAEGGAKLQYPWYCFRGTALVAENLWVEHPGVNHPDRNRIDCNVQEMRGAIFDRPAGKMRLENSQNITIQHAVITLETTLSDGIEMVGDSTVTVNDLWGYKEPGDMDNPRIRWRNFHSFTNRGVPLLTNVTNPTTGNLVINGDFQNGLYGWTITPEGSATTNPSSPPYATVQDAPYEKSGVIQHLRGKELKIDITDDPLLDGVTLETTVTIPPGYEGYDAFFGFRADTDGNCRYERQILEDGEMPLNMYSSVSNSQSAYRIRKIGYNAASGGSQGSTHTFRASKSTRSHG